MKPALATALRWISAALFENLGWKVLSLAVAVIIWALVASEPELATFVTVRVAYKDLPDDLEISSQPVSTVSLEVRGPSGELGDGGMKPAVVIDMSGVQPGERSFAIATENVKLPRSVRLIRAIPSEVRFDFERRATASVKVRPRFAADGQNGYVVAQWEVDPPELTVAGPASHVARIRTVSTDPVDVSGVVGSAEFHVNAFVDEPYVRFQSPPQVTVAVTMMKK